MYVKYIQQIWMIVVNQHCALFDCIWFSMSDDSCNFEDLFSAKSSVDIWGVIPMQTAPWTAMLEIWYVASAGSRWSWSGMPVLHGIIAWGLGLGRISSGSRFNSSDGCYLYLSFVVFRCVQIAVKCWVMFCGWDFLIICLTCFAVESRNLLVDYWDEPILWWVDSANPALLVESWFGQLWLNLWVFPKIGGKPPKSSILIGFSMK